ncbi:hypothetical protein A5661_11925 [Mycobacterium asiaticum]|nr:hypothetical protein A5661_11925 [Mycobacterium asiaticum]
MSGLQHGERQVEFHDVEGRNAPLHCAVDHVTIRPAFPMSLFMTNPGYLLRGIHLFAATPASAKIRSPISHLSLPLVWIVEGCHDDIPALVPVRVITVVPHDITPDAVVVRIDRCHSGSLRIAWAEQ